MSEINTQESEYQARVSMDNTHLEDDGFDPDNTYALDQDFDVESEIIKLDSSPITDTNCHKCGGVGVIVKRTNGHTDASQCTCVKDVWNKKINNIINQFKQSNIPARFANSKFKGAKSFEDVAPQKLKKWLENVTLKGEEDGDANSFIFLCGKIGNGKTHLASECAKRFILKTGGSAKYLHADELIESKKDSTVFADRKNLKYKRNHDQIIQEIRNAELVIIDEIGQKKVSDFGREAFEVFVDLRYQSGLPTIFISNHTFRPDTTYNGKLIEEIVGRRVSDRLKEALIIEFNEESKRGLKDTFSTSVATKECEDFTLPIVKKGQTSVMHWVVRNSVFRVVSKHDRQRLTAQDERGQIIETTRPMPEVLYDIWHKGSRLEVNGPVCDFDDHDVYLALTEILHDLHRGGGNGIILKTYAFDLLSRLGKDPKSGANKIWLRRSLDRLAGIRIKYSDTIGNTWGGGIISSYLYEGEKKGQRIIVSFNPFMVPAYVAGRYSQYKLSDSRKFSQLAKGILAFMETQEGAYKNISLEKWRKVLGQENIELKLFKFRFKKALDELVQENFLAQASHIDSQDLVNVVKNLVQNSDFPRTETA